MTQDKIEQLAMKLFIAKWRPFLDLDIAERLTVNCMAVAEKFYETVEKVKEERIP